MDDDGAVVAGVSQDHSRNMREEQTSFGASVVSVATCKARRRYCVLQRAASMLFCFSTTMYWSGYLIGRKRLNLTMLLMVWPRGDLGADIPEHPHTSRTIVTMEGNIGCYISTGEDAIQWNGNALFEHLQLDGHLFVTSEIPLLASYCQCDHLGFSRIISSGS